MLKDTPTFSSFSVDDLDAAQKFYGDTLGLGAESEQGGLTLKLGGGAFAYAYPKADHQPATFTVLNFTVDDIGATIEGLGSRGVTFGQYDDPPLPTDERGVFAFGDGGPWMAWFKDPAGNVLALVQLHAAPG